MKITLTKQEAEERLADTFTDLTGMTRKADIEIISSQGTYNKIAAIKLLRDRIQRHAVIERTPNASQAIAVTTPSGYNIGLADAKKLIEDLAEVMI